MAFTVFIAENVIIIRTPIKHPKRNAFAERWIRSVEECPRPSANSE